MDLISEQMHAGRLYKNNSCLSLNQFIMAILAQGFLKNLGGNNIHLYIY